MTASERVNLGLRVLMEVGIVAALADWGWHLGGSGGTRALLAIAAPLVGFGFWGAVDFRRAGRLAEPLRLVQELAVSGLAALAWWVAGTHALGLSLAGLSVVYHAAVYASGARLLKERATETPQVSRPAG